MGLPATLTEQIKEVKNMDLSYRTLHNKVIIKNDNTNTNIITPFCSIINKYADLLDEIVIKVVLPDKLYSKYKYQPKLIAEEIYGNAELWDVILVLNNCKSVMEFNKRTVKIYDPEKFKEYIDEILMNEESTISLKSDF